MQVQPKIRKLFFGRPEYPLQLIDYLYSHYISTDSVIADIGCGTGKFTKLILDRGNSIWGVEPNEDMRNKAVDILKEYTNLTIVNGTADAIGLSDNSVDFITTAQAFHWFEVESFYNECRRIIKNNGYVALIWNVRDMSSKFNCECYDIYKKYCPEFKGFSGGIQEDDKRIKSFFNNQYEKIIFDNPLTYTKDKFIKRCLSGSYSLTYKDKMYSEYICELEQIFDNYSKDNTLVMPNYTVAYIGKIK